MFSLHFSFAPQIFISKYRESELFVERKQPIHFSWYKKAIMSEHLPLHRAAKKNRCPALSLSLSLSRDHGRMISINIYLLSSDLCIVLCKSPSRAESITGVAHIMQCCWEHNNRPKQITRGSHYDSGSDTGHNWYWHDGAAGMADHARIFVGCVASFISFSCFNFKGNIFCDETTVVSIWKRNFIEFYQI